MYIQVHMYIAFEFCQKLAFNCIFQLPFHYTLSMGRTVRAAAICQAPIGDTATYAVTLIDTSACPSVGLLVAGRTTDGQIARERERDEQRRQKEGES